MFVTSGLEQSPSPGEANEIRWRNVMGLATAATVCYDAMGRIQFWNSAAEHLFGWTAEEVVDRAPGELPESMQSDLVSWFARVRDGETLTGVRLHRRRKDGSHINVHVWAWPVRDPAGRLEGVTQLFTPAGEPLRRPPESVDALLQRQTLQAQRFHSTLVSLAKQRHPDVPSALRSLTAMAGQALACERVGVWLFNTTRDAVSCVCLHRLSDGSYEAGTALTAKEYPRYFKALNVSRTIAAHHARTDERTSEYRESYLEPMGITSMLDVPIRLGGDEIGIVCHEHVGPPREWTLEEQAFAAAIADMVSLALETGERARLEEEQERLQRQLQAAQRLESLGFLAGAIAHDFNGMLTATLSYLDLAQLQVPSNSPVGELLQKAQLASNRAADLAQQLLTYAGRGQRELKRVDFSVLILDMLEILRLVTSKRGELKLELAATLPAVMGDAVQLRQVIMNLVQNAADALPASDGRVVLKTMVAELDRTQVNDLALRAAALQPGTFAALQVADNGLGIDAEQSARIFEPFFTTKSSGRGLGLSTVAGIVRSHGGGLSLDSKLGVGSTFTVYLPALPPTGESRSL